jgi:predicted ribosomally synthesized peptide with nif11-like leader
MSQQALIQIIAVAQQNKELQNQLQLAATPEDFVNIAAKYGYEFTVEELIERMKEQVAAYLEKTNATDSFLEELSDEEAEMVAGGRMTAYRVSVNSYYHETGVQLLSGFCFWLKNAAQVNNDPFQTRSKMVSIAEQMGTFRLLGSDADGYSIELEDDDGDSRGGWFGSYTWRGIAGYLFG